MFCSGKNRQPAISHFQITAEERCMISTLSLQGWKPAWIAGYLGRHRSTIGRELVRNRCPHGVYRPSKADRRTRHRRWALRRAWRVSNANSKWLSLCSNSTGVQSKSLAERFRAARRCPTYDVQVVAEIIRY